MRGRDDLDVDGPVEAGELRRTRERALLKRVSSTDGLGGAVVLPRTSRAVCTAHDEVCVVLRVPQVHHRAECGLGICRGSLELEGLERDRLPRSLALEIASLGGREARVVSVAVLRLLVPVLLLPDHLPLRQAVRLVDGWGRDGRLLGVVVLEGCVLHFGEVLPLAYVKASVHGLLELLLRLFQLWCAPPESLILQQFGRHLRPHWTLCPHGADVGVVQI